MHLRTRCFLAILLLLLPAVALGADPATAAAKPTPPLNKRPTLGLVLEGGGALGLAHVGVIQYLEEHHIPVDYIAGTSMGGLVGGLYATGRNAAQVREVVDSVNWTQVMSGQVPFTDLSYRRKQDAREYPSTLEFGLRKGLQVPAGFNTGQDVSLILDRVALPYSQIKSFDDLPIPFACVATDLVDASEHVFRNGPLDLALRSTMSLPGIFTPVSSNGHIYVDGGLMNNIPVSVAKSMGAEYTLGIHLMEEPIDPKATLNTFGVLGASISAVISANERRAMAQADMLINVPLQKYSMLDFQAADTIIKAGYAAAAAQGDKLATLSVDDETWKQYLANREARRRKALTPQFVTVKGQPPDLAAPIARDFSGFAGKPVDTTQLDHDILDLMGTGPFSVINYSMVDNQAGQPGLQIQAENKPYSPPIIRPLILIDGASYDNVFFSVGARVTYMNFGGYRRELRLDGIFGSQYGASAEYYRPFSNDSNWFVAPRALYNNAQYPIFNGNDFLALYRNRIGIGGLDLGYGFGKTGEFRFGYEGGYESLKPQIGNDKQLPTVSGTTGDFKIQYILDTLDHPVVPRKGESIKFYTKYFNENPAAPHGFPQSELIVQNFFKLTAPSSIFLNAEGGTTYGFNAGIPAFQLGGVTRFVAFGTNELLTDQYFLFQTGYIRTLKQLPPLLGSTIDFLGMFEIGKTYQLPMPNAPPPPYLPGDVAGALIVNTIFGPVEVGGAVGDYGHAKFFFQIGRIF